MVQRVLLAIAVAIALSPVVGMVLVFALLPALPLVIAIGAMLGPSTLLGYAQQEEDEREREEEQARYLRFRQAHAHAH
jgi:hypothetical protein